MRGHIRERSPGHWAIVLDLHDRSGRRRRKWHSFRGTKRAAERECARLITEMADQVYVERDRKSLNQFLDAWRPIGCQSMSPLGRPSGTVNY